MNKFVNNYLIVNLKFIAKNKKIKNSYVISNVLRLDEYLLEFACKSVKDL